MLIEAKQIESWEESYFVLQKNSSIRLFKFTLKLGEIMISFDKGSSKFNFRAAGIAVCNNRLLLHTTRHDDFWSLPGGRVEFNESTDLSLVREFKEELDIDIHIERLVYVNEDFFEYDKKQFQEIGFYYLISFPNEHEITWREGEFPGIEDEGRLIFKWFTFEEVNKIKVFPEILKSDLINITETRTIKHCINHQNSEG